MNPLLIWLGKRLGHWVVYAILFGVAGWGVYVTLIKPHTSPTPTTAQQADAIINYNTQLRTSFGCSHTTLRIKDGE